MHSWPGCKVGSESPQKAKVSSFQDKGIALGVLNYKTNHNKLSSNIFSVQITFNTYHRVLTKVYELG